MSEHLRLNEAAVQRAAQLLGVPLAEIRGRVARMDAFLAAEAKAMPDNAGAEESNYD